MRFIHLKLSLLSAVAFTLVACSKGGQLTLEPGAIKVKAKGSPYVSVVQGAKANLTSTDGITGWATVQAVSSRDISNATHTMIINKAGAHTSN